MIKVTVKQTRERLRHCIDMAEQGEQIVVSRRGRPVVRLVTADLQLHTAAVTLGIDALLLTAWQVKPGAILGQEISCNDVRLSGCSIPGHSHCR